MALPEINMDGIQFEVLRKKIDLKFQIIHESLSEAYYGARGPDGRFDRATGWQAGVNATWAGLTGAQWAAEYGLDPQNPATAKAVFDDLHGRLHQIYDLVFHEENLKEAAPYPRDEYDPIEEETSQRKIERARSSARWIKINRPQAYAKFKNWALANGFTANEEATD